MGLLLAIWHIPGRIWAGMMAAAPARNWAQVGAAMVLTPVLVGYGVVIWKGPWPDRLAGKQLDLLGQGQLIAGFLLLVALICITGLTLNLNVSKDGLTADLERDEPSAASSVKTTAIIETETKP